MFSLHAILDVDAAGQAGWDVPALASAFLDGGARLIQLRAKQLPSARFLEYADALVRAAAPYGAAVIINDRADVARLAGAGGVHVGQDDLPPVAARQILGTDAIVGYSTHTVAQIEAAVKEPVSYIAIGPVFSTPTKETGYEPVGPERVADAVRIARGLPVIAIGGITLDNVRRAIDAGAAGVAVIGDLLSGGDPGRQVAAYLRVIGL